MNASPAGSFAAGAAGGLVGTVAMSAVMLSAGWLGLMGAQPPRRVVDAASNRTRRGHGDDTGSSGDDERSREAQASGEGGGDGARDVAASLLHLAVGTAAGGVLGVVRDGAARSGVRLPPAASGAAFGLALWAVNYAAIAPALDILPPPHEDRGGRPPSMIIAHLVFGITSGVVADRLAGSGGSTS